MSADDLPTDRATPREHTVEPHVQDWIEKVRSGDAAAFGELCRYYRPKLVGTAAGRGQNDAEDVAQEVLIRAWQNREKMTSPGLLFAILKNILIDRDRREELRDRYAEQLANGLAVEPDEDARIDNERRRRCLAQAFAVLPKEDRVLVTTKRQGMTFDNMATLFKRPETTIRRHFNRIVERITTLVDLCLKRSSA